MTRGPNSKTYLSLEEEFGTVHLTRREVDLIISVTKGQNGFRLPSQGGTLVRVKSKILGVTHWWDIKFTQVCCRFAYRNGLVKL